MELSENLKKNLLDLKYNKYLQYHNTCIIILFTYFIGVIIAYVTNQINYKAFNENLLAGIISIIIIFFILILISNFNEHLENITNEIKKLKL
ncbi:MAG: hypothetical protein WC438_00815 [Candidatus Pacearchaeota archaeon]